MVCGCLTQDLGYTSANRGYFFFFIYFFFFLFFFFIIFYFFFFFVGFCRTPMLVYKRRQTGDMYPQCANKVLGLRDTV